MESARKDGATILIVEKKGEGWVANWLAQLPESTPEDVLRLTRKAIKQRASDAAQDFQPYGLPQEIRALPPGLRPGESEPTLWAIGECAGRIIVMDAVGRCGVSQGGQLVDFGTDLVDLLERI